MRYTAEHKKETKHRILAAAGRSFRKEGFSMTGIDGLARRAGFTSGAFYSHFRSKVEAFRAALTTGLQDLRQGIEECQRRAAHAPDSGEPPREERDGHEEDQRWVQALADFYFTERVTCDLADGCALPSLIGDVARADARTKASFEKEFLGIVATMAKGLSGPSPEEREARAIVMVALFAGGVTIARSVRDKVLRDRIAHALREAVVASAARRA